MNSLRQLIKNGKPVTEDQVHQVVDIIAEDLIKDANDLFDKYIKEYDIEIVTSDTGIIGWNIGAWIEIIKDVVLTKLEDELNDH